MSKTDSMDSLINRAYASSRFAINANDNNRNSNSTWKYDWFTPLVQDDPVAIQNMGNSERNASKKYPFRFKKWIPAQLGTEGKEVDEQGQEQEQQAQQFGSSINETLKPLDLSKFDTKLVQNMLNRKLGERASGSNADRNTGDDDSLTVEDIRGAVGNSDSIPGLSSSLSSSTAQSKTKTTVNQTTEKKDEATISAADSTTTTGTVATTATNGNTTVEVSKMTDISETQSAVEALPSNEGDDGKINTGKSDSPIPDADDLSKPTESSTGNVIAENPTVEPENSPRETNSDDGKPAEDDSESPPHLDKQPTNESDKDQGQSQNQNEAEENDVEMED